MRLLQALLVITPLALPPATHAQPRTRADCEAAHPATLGQAGKDVVWVPTDDTVVLAMLSLAQVMPHDLVVDLGAGDGKIPIAAARKFGARALGIEYEPGLARRAACLVEAEGLGARVRIVEGDIFREDLGPATVVTLYLLPQLNLCVRPRLLALPPGTRVVSHQYDMDDWKPEETLQIQGRTVHRWTVPARVDGLWDFRDSAGETLTLDLRQAFATAEGAVVRGGAREALTSASVRGRELRFAAGPALRFAGTVHGQEIRGLLTTGATSRTASGRLRGALRAAPWAEPHPGCAPYYAR